MLLTPIILSWILIIIGIAVFTYAVQKSKNNQFYTNTFLLTPLGVFVWGDGLVLGLFWALTGLGWWIFGLDFTWIWRYYLFFWMLRAGYEVIYWLNLQAVKSDYKPPLTENIPWLNADQGQIIYQVAQMCVMLLAGFALIYSFF